MNEDPYFPVKGSDCQNYINEKAFVNEKDDYDASMRKNTWDTIEIFEILSNV